MTTLTTTGPAARDLSPFEQEQRATKCYELDQAIKAGLRAGREAMWETARALHEFDEENGWTALGYEKIGDWLADTDVGMTRSQHYRLVSVYRELVVHRQVSQDDLKQLDVSKVDIVLPAVKSGRVTLKDALSDVKALGARDLRDSYIKRPDPKDTVPAATPNTGTTDATDSSTCSACGLAVGHASDCMYANPPVNDGDDTPVLASDVQPAQNGEGPLSGQVHDGYSDQNTSVDELDGPGTHDVIDGDDLVIETVEAVPVARPANDQLFAAHELARVMWRIGEEVAPAAKKRMSNDLREDVVAVIKLAIEAGLLDA